MRNNYIFLFIFLIFSSAMVGQKVTLTPTVVNGASFSGGAINLASVPTSTISLAIKVEIPTNVAVGDNGTIKIFFSKGLALGGNVAIGGDGGTLYFGGGKVATKSFVINLNWTDFLTSGGFIYAEYKSGVSYNSSNIAVIKNATMTSGTTLNPPADAPNPTKIVNTLCCNQTIRLGDKPAPITGSQYLNPYKEEPYGINSQWGAANGSIINLDDVNRVLTLDYTKELKNITVYRKLGYRYGGEFPNKSNDVIITVVPTPILTNTIFPNDIPLNPDGYYELSGTKTINLSGYVSFVNLNILQDPNHTNQRGDNIVDVDGYRWEYHDDKLYNNPWIVIPNETTGTIDFTNPNSLNLNDENYSIRRIAIYKNISRVSNIIKIAIKGIRNNNTICCDQILKIFSSTDFEKPQTIVGSTPAVDKAISGQPNFFIQEITYQWQNQSRPINGSTSIWSNIVNATSKDYLPTQPLIVNTSDRGRGFETSYNYRRIAKIYYKYFTNKWIYENVSSYSNETFLNGTKYEPYIKLFPNPSTTILNIETTSNITNSKITISNITGVIVNTNNFTLENSNLISINVSNLTPGTYFLTIENDNLGIINKIFIKQ